MTTTRDRPDLCPGVFRPWPADDGALVRLRPAGGRISTAALMSLVEIAEKYGDGRVHLTSRANLQLRALPLELDGRIPAHVVEDIEATGLLPSRTHELVRNIMVSPQTGIAPGGKANLQGLTEDLDTAICADPRMAELPGRFLFVLDDGRGDLLDRRLDLGVVATSDKVGQIRAGSNVWGAITSLSRMPEELVRLAHQFLDSRGEGPSAAWHVDELEKPLFTPCGRYWGTEVSTPPLEAGLVPGGLHLLAPDGAVDRETAQTAVDRSQVAVVTPWKGLLLPKPTNAEQWP